MVGGYGLGTSCVIDVEPRTPDQALIDERSDLASVVMDQLELRLSARTALYRAQLMAREIDHRVMNSLQFVSGLIAMQSRTADATPLRSYRMRRTACQRWRKSTAISTQSRPGRVRRLHRASLRRVITCAGRSDFRVGRRRQRADDLDPTDRPHRELAPDQRGKARRRQSRGGIPPGRRPFPTRCV